MIAIIAISGQALKLRFSPLSQHHHFAMMPAMDVIDGDWIRARLPKTRGSQKALADAMGIAPHQMNKILSGKRQVQAHEIPRLLAFFKAEAASGMAEPAQAPFGGAFAAPLRPADRLDSITRACCPSANRPFHYIARRSEPAAGVICGDVLVITHGNTAAPGGLVLVSLAGEAWEGSNELRRYFPPHLAAIDPGHPEQALDENSGRAAVIGTVAAVLRAPELIAD